MANQNIASDKVFNMMQSVNKETNLLHEGYAEKARGMRDMGTGKGRANLDKEGNIVGYSTHRMQTEVGEAIGATSGEWYSFPTLFPHKDRPNRWIDYDKGGDIEGAYLEAKGRGEVFEFGQDKKESEKFAKGSWKPK